MASYMLLVLVPPSTEDIEEKVAELIELYSRWIKLPPYFLLLISSLKASHSHGYDSL